MNPNADQIIAQNLGLLMIENARLAAKINTLVAENAALKAATASVPPEINGTVYGPDQG